MRGAGMSEHAGLQRVAKWFADRGIEPFEFQRQTWHAYLAGESGLIQAPTGMGKTLAAALGPMMDSLDGAWASRPSIRGSSRKRAGETPTPRMPLTILWITPLRALAS